MNCGRQLHRGGRLYCPACGPRVAKDRERARKKDAFVERVYRNYVYERDGWMCQLCGEPLARHEKVPHDFAPTLDHIIPLSRGGTHEYANVQAAHFICNSRKGARPVGEQLLLVG